MVIEQKAAPPIRFADKEALIKLSDELDAQAGIVHDPTATVEQVRELMRAAGIRPEDNILSRDIIRAKYPDDQQE
jgi:hypothetical protein